MGGRRKRFAGRNLTSTLQKLTFAPLVPLSISSGVVQTPCKLVYKIAFEGIICDLGNVPRAGMVSA